MVRYISFKIQDMRASHADVLRLVTHKNVCVYQAVDRPLPIEVIDLEYTRFQYFWNDKLYWTWNLRLNNTHAFSIVYFFRAIRSPPPQVRRFPCAYVKTPEKLTHVGLYCGGQKRSFVWAKKYRIIPVGNGEIFQGNEPQLICPCRLFVQCLRLVFRSESCTRGKIWGNKPTYVDLATTALNIPDDIGTSPLVIRLFRRSHDLFHVCTWPKRDELTRSARLKFEENSHVCHRRKLSGLGLVHLVGFLPTPCGVLLHDTTKIVISRYYNTGYSYLVTHPDANPTWQGLTLLSGRDVV